MAGKQLKLNIGGQEIGAELQSKVSKDDLYGRVEHVVEQGGRRMERGWLLPDGTTLRKGQVAMALAETPWPAGVEVLCRGRDAIDLGRPEAAQAAIRELRPQLVINAAAFTAVDLAESEREAAFAINRDGAAAAAVWC